MKPPAAGSASASFASIGSTGGSMAKIVSATRYKIFFLRAAVQREMTASTEPRGRKRQNGRPAQRSSANSVHLRHGCRAPVLNCSANAAGRTYISPAGRLPLERWLRHQSAVETTPGGSGDSVFRLGGTM